MRLVVLLYQSCYYGCITGYTSTLENGCDNREEVIIINDNDVKDGYYECLKYQNVLPKPDIFTFCREYFITGSKMGFEKSRSFYSNDA